MQLVFTHNCEHGWIHAHPASLDDDFGVWIDDATQIQIGPEQLVAILALNDQGSLDINSRETITSYELKTASS